MKVRAALGLCFAVMSGCAQDAQPERSVQTFYTLVSQGKEKEALNLLKTGEGIDPAKAGVGLYFLQRQIKTCNGLKEVEVLETRRVGESAEVVFRLKMNGDGAECSPAPDVHHVVNVQGTWSIFVDGKPPALFTSHELKALGVKANDR